MLWSANKNKQKFLLYCEVDGNRSRMIKDCYTFMITGVYSNKSSLALNINDNQMTGIFRTEVFLKSLSISICYQCRIFHEEEVSPMVYPAW